MLAGLSGQHSLGLVTMSFSLAILLVGILYRDLFVHEVLATHVGDRSIRRLEITKGHESVALGQVVVISRNLCSG